MRLRANRSLVEGAVMKGNGVVQWPVGEFFSSSDVVHHVHKCSHFPSTSAGVRHSFSLQRQKTAPDLALMYSAAAGQRRRMLK